MMKRNIVVSEAEGRPVASQSVEMVERKGIGHPDSLCDGIAEQIARTYSSWCEQHIGYPLHHNFDKVQLVAGQTVTSFGSGEMIRPIRIQIAGRGSDKAPNGRDIPVHLLAIQAARDHLSATVRHLNPDKQCIIDCFSGSGASELITTVDDIRANDTSFGVGHWPLSPLEELVLTTAEAINQDFITRFPIGEDIKVMGLRMGSPTGLPTQNHTELICAVPLLCTHVLTLSHYQELKAELQAALATFAAQNSPLNPTVVVNAADGDSAGSIYLTLTGTSAECGDDGSVGRGNRVNGLITPFRPSSLEAAAGKNAISHTGKLYNLLALEIAKEIVAQLSAVAEANVFLLSQIGQPLDQPRLATAKVHLHHGALTPGIEAEIDAIINQQLQNLDQLRRNLKKGQLQLF